MTRASKLVENEQYDLAIDAYLDSLNQFPDDGRPYAGLSRAYWLNNQPEQAFQAIEDGWDLNAGNVHFYVGAARIYEKAGLLEAALNAYETTLRYNPDYPAALQGVERLGGN
jgi:tetratricopeptide (TPR) repeat protein